MSHDRPSSLDPLRQGLLIALMVIATATVLVALSRVLQEDRLSAEEQEAVEDLVDERMERHPRARPSQQNVPTPPHPIDDPPPSTDVFVVVEQMPELIGGLAAIQRQITYPDLARKAGIEGRVIVQFIVDETGQVTSAEVVRGIGGGCDEEALRAVRSVRFKPGIQRGQPVKVKMSVPVTFRLQ